MKWIMMVMKPRSVWKRYALTALSALALLGAVAPFANATDLPPGVLTYLRQKDPHVKVRFDGLVLFSNGESYVPVIPQDPSLSPDSQQVISTVPEKAAYPDLIQFDNNFFLMRLIQTSTGRLTFPKLTTYPLQLKEGLLPQDLVMPNNLFIPVELKVILGALPYNPSYTPQPTQSVVPLAVTLNSGQSGEQFKTTSRQTYIFDLNDQKILAIDPITGSKTGDVALDCAPSTLKLSPDGKLLFVPCLASNELVVIDTGSNLVKTRIPVGQRPDAVVYVYPTQDVVISNRYSSYLSVVGSEELVSGDTIKLEEGASGGAMALIPGEKLPKLLVADAFKSTLYTVDVLNKRVEKSWKALPEISSILVLKNDKGLPEIWVASRTENKVMVLDNMGRPIKTLDVAKKPVDLVAFDQKVFVLSAGESQLQLIDAKEKTIVSTIPLETDGFPSGIVAVPTEKLAYVSMAASRNLLVLNLESGRVERTLPVEFRASMIGMTPDKQELAQFPAISPADLPQAKPPEPSEEPSKKKKETKDKDATAKAKPKSTDVKTNAKKESAPSETAQKSVKTPEKAGASLNNEKSPQLQSTKTKNAKKKPANSSETNDAGRADTTKMVYPSAQSGVISTPGANGGKFRLNVIKLGRDTNDDTQQEPKAKPAKDVAKPKKDLETADKAQGKEKPSANKTGANVKTDAKTVVPAATKAGQAAQQDEKFLPAKAGARIEQKPLAMPLDLPAESSLPAGKSTTDKQGLLAPKDDKIKGDGAE